MIAEIYPTSLTGPEFHEDANASLIAAAPDLLEALKQWSLGECLVFDSNSNPECHCNGCVTRRAIAKAEGK